MSPQKVEEVDEAVEEAELGIEEARAELLAEHERLYEYELKAIIQERKIRELEQRLAPKSKEYPHVQVRVRGTMNMLMQMAEEGYKKKNTGMECRFVYAPEKSDRALANYAKYRARGYVPVMVSQCKLETPELFGGPTDKVRIGDEILMAIEREKKIERFQDSVRVAVQQANVTEEAGRAEIDAEVKKGSSYAKGAGKLKKTSHDYDVGPKAKED